MMNFDIEIGRIAGEQLTILAIGLEGSNLGLRESLAEPDCAGTNIGSSIDNQRATPRLPDALIFLDNIRSAPMTIESIIALFKNLLQNAEICRAAAMHEGATRLEETEPLAIADACRRQLLYQTPPPQRQPEQIFRAPG